MKIFQVWVLPVAAMTALLVFLMIGMPYAYGYGWLKLTLGGVTHIMWMMSSGDWEHCSFVPYICLALVAFQIPKLRRAPIRGSNWAAGLIVLGLLVYYLGLKAEMQYFGFAAIQILVAGLILWFWGTEVFKLVSFAWLFLLFTWPLPFLDGVVALPLRLDMSWISAHQLNLLGTHCVENGTAVLSAPDRAAGLRLGEKFQVDIADPCSGLHSLFALTMLSALAGYAAVQNQAARVLVFLASIPLAIAGNVVRILLLVWAAERFGPSILGTEENPSSFHLACGYVVYFVALGLLIGLIVFFNSRTFQRAWAAGRAWWISHSERAAIFLRRPHSGAA
jgi:exosortase